MQYAKIGTLHGIHLGWLSDSICAVRLSRQLIPNWAVDGAFLSDYKRRGRGCSISRTEGTGQLGFSHWLYLSHLVSSVSFSNITVRENTNLIFVSYKWSSQSIQILGSSYSNAVDYLIWPWQDTTTGTQKNLAFDSAVDPP